MRAWLITSGLIAGLVLGATVPGLVGCSCGYFPPAPITYTIIEAPLEAFLGATVEVTGESEASQLIIRSEWQGQKTELTYELLY